LTDSELKEILIDCICFDESFDWDDPDLISFWDWMIQEGLGLSNA